MIEQAMSAKLDEIAGYLRELTAGREFAPFMVEGENYFIKELTFYYIGQLVSKDPAGFVLNKATWVASTGPLTSFLRQGKIEEAEHFPDPIFINWGTGVCATRWRHELPYDQAKK